ncbi:hypothetical protein KQX54_018530 [Cotesia glomerata]|uniref:Uncharacterized protein n=1 Tax=Cotesia glomerata TaxID=32391 RepID=A0AAV7HV97_COTGL|nr:hypothetical protein KQX54_018530 [Cotesia glomerata]
MQRYRNSSRRNKKPARGFDKCKKGKRRWIRVVTCVLLTKWTIWTTTVMYMYIVGTTLNERRERTPVEVPFLLDFEPRWYCPAKLKGNVLRARKEDSVSSFTNFRSNMELGMLMLMAFLDDPANSWYDNLENAGFVVLETACVDRRFTVIL